MEKFWTRASDMAGAPSMLGGQISWVLRKRRLGHGIRVIAIRVPRLTHGPGRDVVAAGGLVRRAPRREVARRRAPQPRPPPPRPTRPAPAEPRVVPLDLGGGPARRGAGAA